MWGLVVSKSDSDLGPFGPHLGVIRWGGQHVGVMFPFCTKSEKHPHVRVLQKLVEQIVYTLPLDTVNFLGTYVL